MGPAVIDVVFGQVFRFARACGEKSELRGRFLALGNGPFSIGRERNRTTFAQKNCRRAIGLANVNGVSQAARFRVIQSAPTALLIEKKGFAVG